MAYSNLDDFDYKKESDPQYNFFQDEDTIYRFRPVDKINMVDSPAHYTRGRVEAIDVIEDAIQDAPTVTKGMLQSQVLKYMLRLWLKDKPVEDAKKARWYLDRLISKIEKDV